MGVPSFFRWLMSYNNNLIKSVCIKNVDYLMIDCNCLLHPCVAYINKKEINIHNRDIIEKLKLAGAEVILVVPIEKMIL